MEHLVYVYRCAKHPQKPIYSVRRGALYCELCGRLTEPDADKELVDDENHVIRRGSGRKP